MSTAVHNLSKAEIKRFAVQKRDEGAYYDRSIPHQEDNFHGSIDRFCDIAWRFRNHRRVLDVGSGDGLLLVLLKLLGHEVYAVDFMDHSQGNLYIQHEIPFQVCNIEADSLPYDDASMDAISCCQVLEHFTHSHLPPVLEMKRVLRDGGILEIDVPNAVCFRNRSRLIRGKHITYDYKTHYLNAAPVEYNGREYYPQRHNREFTQAELDLLLTEAQFKEVDVQFLKSRRYREGIAGNIQNLGTALKDAVPSFRKSLIAFAVK